ncbi:MAG: FKBP-type peptidyl-prolyl cis-trans isomerase [Acidobacteriota bacterium]
MKSHPSLYRTALSLLWALLILAPGAQASAEELDTDDKKTLYALGIMVGQNLGQLKLSAEELATVKQGLDDSAMGREPKVAMQEFAPKIQAFAQARMTQAAAGEKEKAAEFQAKKAAMEGAMRKESGLIIREITAGTGASPAATDKVSVHYHGTLRDGTVFDSSVDRGQPASFPLNQVIKCWTEGLQLMKVGGKSELTCPSDIAYGDQGRPGIPPGATLVFEVELLSIEGDS